MATWEIHHWTNHCPARASPICTGNRKVEIGERLQPHITALQRKEGLISIWLGLLKNLKGPPKLKKKKKTNLECSFTILTNAYSTLICISLLSNSNLVRQSLQLPKHVLKTCWKWEERSADHMTFGPTWSVRQIFRPL